MEIHTRNIESVQDDREEQLCDALRARLYFFWRRVSLHLLLSILHPKIGIRVMATMVFISMIRYTTGPQVHVQHLVMSLFVRRVRRRLELPQSNLSA